MERLSVMRMTHMAVCVPLISGVKEGAAMVTPLVKDMCCLKTSKYLSQTSRNLDKTFGNPCAGHVIPTLGECILKRIPGS